MSYALLSESKPIARKDHRCIWCGQAIPKGTLSQTVNGGWDTYSDAVVAADSELEARMTHPNNNPWNGKSESLGTWSSAEDVKVEYLGTAKRGTPKGVICASFHAG